MKTSGQQKLQTLQESLNEIVTKNAENLKVRLSKKYENKTQEAIDQAKRQYELDRTIIEKQFEANKVKAISQAIAETRAKMINQLST